ncbi:hypothetical protein GGTG_04148 [Gaeumannomyces tritici R3-111a-1]|uniref:Polyketide synthase C-terminal extension domain-containing protein n=1 Tax=Gaeumannomyces tritici (strain R3-111a-1) TaxID=644352 RepID=J3NSA3_GAET3|nr:hypothetical protein GGTG_04148 [Gaeumannomyces tritici R3-111a-1]EJT79059.1 hypothetical protein GGTG_04148 [Gaeumannomyces tritici R3-111a-1]
MLFNKLHADIEPFYTNLEIAAAPKPWPKLADGVPRRASVSSFGFGGTNSHVIVENFVPPTPPMQDTEPLLPSRPFTPFNFSAASAGALRGVLSDYAEYLRSHPDTNLNDLAYTLYARRSHPPSGPASRPRRQQSS